MTFAATTPAGRTPPRPCISTPPAGGGAAIFQYQATADGSLAGYTPDDDEHYVYAMAL
jgi:hypothetical protein